MFSIVNKYLQATKYLLKNIFAYLTSVGEKCYFIISKKERFMIEYRYDTQLLIEGKNLNEDEIREYFLNNFKGDCLIAVGDDTLIKIHFHTNTPWEVLEYCSTLGEIFDIVVEDMDRQSRGLQG